MSTEPEEVQAQVAEVKEAEAPSLLHQAIEATKQTEPDRAKELLENLVEEALKGTVSWSKNVTASINKAIAAIDAQISGQLAAVMHHPELQKLEGTWRGLHYLVMNSETGEYLKIRVLNISKLELFKDLDKAVEFDQSQIFKKIYTSEFDMPGGAPYGALVGDYEFTNHPEDIDLLQKMSQVAAAAFAPFISAAAPTLFGFDSWTELVKPRDLATRFESVEYTKWKSFRQTEDARFVALTMPRVLARLPYGARTKPVEEFAYEEAPIDIDADRVVRRELAHKHYCWMNAAYVLGARLTDAFAKYGWCTAIRGEEGGGKVENLPTDIFTSIDGDLDLKCPTEVGIPDRREAEFSKLGFLPLCHYKNTDYAVFFGAQTTQEPKKYDRPAATANAAISARLPYILASSRFAHYLKVMGRGKVGSFMEASNVEDWLNRWIQNYVNSNPNASQEQKARYPLREAKISVEPIPGKPGSYNAV
ncbi:MAG: type VI secretion system contractile sheath large subunit, partial [Acidobacteria bacterium]|nr:type VI secretion system contractile sheath large subunit [Acidobacteriota bacterium]